MPPQVAAISKRSSGSAALVKTGAGTLTINSANSYTGGTSVAAGKVALDANMALGLRRSYVC
ncbi:MAG: autotransporter-associated beta strand repeat-containing protein [Moraxellaceae bacterium]|nr:autotransporter-associated beta strand repeat-containing protein [Moraxellaceae bacterium]